MKKIKAIKGTVDILPGMVEYWQKIEDVVRNAMVLYGYHELRTPVFEETGLFARSIGEDTDIVGKEMYTFNDMGDRSLTLRPEGTAAVVRAFIQHSLDQRGLPQKLWYRGPMFRQERPQKGRQRQFHQFGVEVIGSPDPRVDAEVMMLFDTIMKNLDLDNCVFSINSIGGADSRTAYREALVGYLDTIEDALCDDCKRRKTTNPLRILDCKVPGCKTALYQSGNLPRTMDFLTEVDRRDFENVQKYLGDSDLSFSCDYSMVRGLDYYTGTVFEVHYKGLGAQSAIMGGGRYDSLLASLGGPDMPAVGFACGIERLILAIQASDSVEESGQAIDVFLVQPDEKVSDRTMKYLLILRGQGIASDCDYMGRSMKAQMRAASRTGAKYAVIIEPGDDKVTVRAMDRSDQDTMTFDSFIEKYHHDKKILNNK
ncbi:histidine--tRNA ligase [Candidatus Latescibacterota bacterium]